MAYHHGDLRHALVQAGREHLRERPASELSLREGARLAGVSHAAPQKHFRRRDDFLVAVAAMCLGEMASAERAAVDEATAVAGGGPGSPGDRLVAAGTAYVTWATDNPHAFALVFDPAVNVHGDTDEELAEAVAAHTGLFVGLVAEAAAAGLLDAAVPTPIHGAHLWSVVHGLAVLVSGGRLPAGAVGPTLWAAIGAPVPPSPDGHTGGTGGRYDRGAGPVR